MMKRRLLLLLLLVLGGLHATVYGHEEAGTVNFEGLTRLDDGPFAESWVDLQVDFPGYTKVILVDPYFQFRAVKRSSSAAARRANQRKFYISENNRERLIREVGEIYRTELGSSRHFTLVDEPGPDVAILLIGVFDIVSRVPPELAGRNEVYLASVGEATLIVELRDSLSLETIFRGIERRVAQRPGSYPQISNTVTNWAEVRRLAMRWATTMREGLDAIHD